MKSHQTVSPQTTAREQRPHLEKDRQTAFSQTKARPWTAHQTRDRLSGLRWTSNCKLRHLQVNTKGLLWPQGIDGLRLNDVRHGSDYLPRNLARLRRQMSCLESVLSAPLEGSELQTAAMNDT